MEVLASILASTDNPLTLAILLMMLFVTKRIVPYWVHDEVKEELAKYERNAPHLTEQVGLLIALLQGSQQANDPIVKEQLERTKATLAESLGTQPRSKEGEEE